MWRRLVPRYLEDAVQSGGPYTFRCLSQRLVLLLPGDVATLLSP